jgi:hypothetical protein
MLMTRQLFIVALTSGFISLAPLAKAGGPLFDDISKDFGNVPRGTILTHQFRLNNPTNAALHVTSLRTSCGCATASVGKDEIQPNESTAVVVTIDTRKYSGPRNFTVYVLIDRPFLEEVRLALQATSRDDVMLTPGQLTFGRIKRGVAAKSTVNIEYHGTANWRIDGIENDNGYLLPQLEETSRLTGHVIYQLSVKLREDLPVGAWHADVWLKTNDAATPRIRVPLVVEVESALTATPAEVVMGAVKTGSQSERKVVIRGSTPFKITAIDGENDRFQVSGKSDEAKAVHVLKITLTAGKEAQECGQHFKVHTDLPQDGEVEFAVQAQVIQ